MSAFLFKQTETAGADCACGARTLGREAGPAPRARAHAGASAGPAWAGRKAGRAWGLADGLGRLAAGKSRQGAACGIALALASSEEPHRALELLWRSGRGRDSRRLWSSPSSCPQLCFLWAAIVRRILTRKGAYYCYFRDRAGFFFSFLRQDAFSRQAPAF